MDDKPITGSQPSERLFALDALRGLIMLLMALDHANWFIAQKHSTGEHWGGPYPIYSDALPFLTRLVTHPCAPGFAFLMGVGMLLFAKSRKAHGWSKWVIWRDLDSRRPINRIAAPGGKPRLGAFSPGVGPSDLLGRVSFVGWRHDPGQLVRLAAMASVSGNRSGAFHRDGIYPSRSKSVGNAQRGSAGPLTGI